MLEVPFLQARWDKCPTDEACRQLSTLLVIVRAYASDEILVGRPVSFDDTELEGVTLKQPLVSHFLLEAPELVLLSLFLRRWVRLGKLDGQLTRLWYIVTLLLH